MTGILELPACIYKLNIQSRGWLNRTICYCSFHVFIILLNISGNIVTSRKITYLN